MMMPAVAQSATSAVGSRLESTLLLRAAETTRTDRTGGGLRRRRPLLESEWHHVLHASEIAVRRDNREIVLQGSGGNPQVILIKAQLCEGDVPASRLLSGAKPMHEGGFQVSV